MSILDNRWDEMPDNLRQIGFDVPDDDEAEEWFYDTFRHLNVSDIITDVQNGRDVGGLNNAPCS